MENNNEKRASRASQTREKEAKKKVWTPPSSLDAPPAPTGLNTDGSEQNLWDSKTLKTSLEELDPDTSL